MTGQIRLDGWIIPPSACAVTCDHQSGNGDRLEECPHTTTQGADINRKGGSGKVKVCRSKESKYTFEGRSKKH